MMRIEAVAQNGIPTKNEPFILTDSIHFLSKSNRIEM